MRMPRKPRQGPVFHGIVGTLVLAVVLAAAVAVPRVTFRLSTDHYVAEFASAAGIEVGDEVHIAGVTAGKVTSVTLAGDRVLIGFRIDEQQPLHSDSTAAVKVATLLGKRYIAIEAGDGTVLAPGSTIPLERTRVPYSLGKLAKDARRAVQELDLSALRSAMNTLLGLTQDPELTRRALNGITKLARMVNQNRQRLDTLLSMTRTVTSQVLSQRKTLLELLTDAKTIASVINSRQRTIQTLISDVHEIADTLRRVLTETEDALGGLLDDLHALTNSLEQRSEAIGQTLEQLASASRYLANASGNGPWVDVSGPAGPLPDNLLCLAGLLEGCR